MDVALCPFFGGRRMRKKKLTLKRDTLQTIAVGSQVAGGANTVELSLCTPCSVAPCGGWDSDVVKIKVGGGKKS